MALNNIIRSLYVHIPFCKAKCPYCGFYSEPAGKHNVAELLDAEISQLCSAKLKNSPKTIYIGGGSPSCIESELLCSFIKQITDITGSVKEFSIEINPGQTDKKLFENLRNLGLDRVSIGAQSFNQADLDFLGRNYTAEIISKTVMDAKDAGFDNINLDMIFAIPGSNMNSWQSNLDKAISLEPKHISAYSLTYEHGTKFDDLRLKGEVEPIDEGLDRDMYYLAIDILGGAGIEQYEISNFAKKGFRCEANMTYWANDSYIGIGPGAASYIDGERKTNFADIKKYITAIRAGDNTAQESQTCEPKDRACETAVLNLRRISGIDLEEFKIRTGFEVLGLFAEPIQRYTRQGLMQIEAGRLYLTKQALAVADSILCDFAG